MIHFRPRRAHTIEEVVERQLCTGCGLCAFLEPDRFEIKDAVEHGRRPFVKPGAPATSGEAIKSCPGVTLSHTYDRADPAVLSELTEAWGPVHAVWEGAASFDDVRYAGSSGGAATALALYCLEKGEADAVLHTAARQNTPYCNQTVLSTTREQLLAATGSRYAPASPCEALDQIEQHDGKTVFIGKPCDVAAVQQARRSRHELDRRLGPVIAFFCAGTPSTRGTLDLLTLLGIDDPRTVRSVRYRGNGWPGDFTVTATAGDGTEFSRSTTYADSWGFVQRYRPWRCYICPDHTGEFADVAVGDPWYRPIKPGEAGSSLIVARTRRGHELVEAAAAAGYLRLDSCDSTLLAKSQPNLLRARGELWGRLTTLRLFGVAIPSYDGFKTFPAWLWELDVLEKLRSLSGTVRRVFRRRLRHPLQINVSEDVASWMA